MHDKVKTILKRLWKTMFFTLVWCWVWIALEIVLYGHAESRTVDNIMTLIAAIIIYKAVS